MYWNKANNLIILDKEWFKIPWFRVFNNKNIIKFNDIKNELSLPLILRSSYSIEDWKKNAFAWIFKSYFLFIIKIIIRSD